MIEDGYLTVSKNGSVVVTTKYVDYVKESYFKQNKNGNELSENTTEALSITGVGNTITITENSGAMYMAAPAKNITTITWSGLSFKLYISSTNVNRILAGQGSASAFVGTLVPGPFGTAMALSLVVVGGLLAYNNAAGNGVIYSGTIILTPILTAVIYWISPQ